MLTPSDDYPIHQTPEPIAHPASGDRNHYDRYFFNGYDRDGRFFFAAALGAYPNRQVIDAAFSVVHGGVERSVFASGRIPKDRRDTQVGGIRVEVLEPLRTLRITASGQGIDADVTFTARTPAIEEPRMSRRAGPTLQFDYTRLTQWGTWEGTITTGGERIVVSGEATLGSRDRSWGVRPVGEQPGGAPTMEMPQFYWLWAPINFPTRAMHLARNDDAHGEPWYQSAVFVPLLSDVGNTTWDVKAEEMRTAEVEVDWEPGTRRSQGARITMVPFRGEPEVVTLTPLLTFQMLGIGYLHPEWGHGRWQGESATHAQEWVLADLDPLALPHLHIQQVVRAEAGGETGIGVLEQLVIGPHAPSGFEGIVDGAR